MKTAGRILLGLIGLVIALPVLAFLAWWGWAHFVQSPRYAANFFAGLVEFEDVVESRRWLWGRHPWGGSAFGCTYAIVRIPKTASPTPPATWERDWAATPVIVRDGRHDILDECRHLWPDALNARLIRAHDTPGSYYRSGPEVLLLYAPKEDLAARIRFGD